MGSSQLEWEGGRKAAPPPRRSEVTRLPAPPAAAPRGSPAAAAPRRSASHCPATAPAPSRPAGRHTCAQGSRGGTQGALRCATLAQSAQTPSPTAPGSRPPAAAARRRPATPGGSPCESVGQPKCAPQLLGVPKVVQVGGRHAVLVLRPPSLPQQQLPERPQRHDLRPAGGTARAACS